MNFDYVFDLSLQFFLTDGHPTIFSVKLHHGGEFTNFPGRKYVRGKVNYVDLVDMDTFSVHDIDDLMEELGYCEEGNLLFYHFLRPTADLDFGLFALACDQDVLYLGQFVANHKLIDIYIEHGKTNLHTYSMSPNHSKVRLVEISDRPTSSRRLFLPWHDIRVINVADEVETEITHTDDVETEITPPSQHELDTRQDNDFVAPPSQHEMDKDFVTPPRQTDMDNMLDVESDEGSDSEDSDFFVDENNILDEVDVDMRDFEMNIDQEAEWVEGSSNPVVDEGVMDEDIEVINTEVLESASESDEEMGTQRRKSIRAIRQAHENDQALVSEPFYLFQKFASAKDFKDKVKLHAIETRRELELEKNDKNRVRFKCRGSFPSLGNIGPSQQEAQEKEGPCPWVIYASKWKKDINWEVKTYNKEHRCLQTREVKACTYKFLSTQILDQVEVNPEIPVRALQEQLEKQYQVDISEMKAFRARTEALHRVRGDYGAQYNLLREYILELQTRNPETTVKLDVESEPNPSSETRTFKRIYICLGALKKGFAAGKRDFLGLDGAFMKGPYPGQILSAVVSLICFFY